MYKLIKNVPKWHKKAINKAKNGINANILEYS